MTKLSSMEPDSMLKVRILFRNHRGAASEKAEVGRKARLSSFRPQLTGERTRPCVRRLTPRQPRSARHRARFYSRGRASLRLRSTVAREARGSHRRFFPGTLCVLHRFTAIAPIFLFPRVPELQLIG